MTHPTIDPDAQLADAERAYAEAVAARDEHRAGPYERARAELAKQDGIARQHTARCEDLRARRDLLMGSQRERERAAANPYTYTERGTLDGPSLELALSRIRHDDKSSDFIYVHEHGRIPVSGDGLALAAIALHVRALPSADIRPFSARLAQALGLA
jgi:hypothetical protein